jgi:hypothetical protein
MKRPTVEVLSMVRAKDPLMSETAISKEQLADAVKAESLSTFISTVEFEQLDQVGQFFSELHNEGLLDLFDYFESLDWSAMSSRDRMRMSHALAASVAHVQSKPARCLQFFHTMMDQASEHDHYYIQKGFEGWTAKNTSVLAEAVNLLKTGPRDSELLSVIIIAWRDTDIRAALQATVELSHDPRLKMRSQAIFAIGTFNYPSVQQNEAAEARLLALVYSANVDDQAPAIGAITRVQPHCYVLIFARISGTGGRMFSA